MKLNAKEALVLVFSVLVCFAAGAVGSALQGQAIAEWYPALAKPWFTPPAWLFGPVWTALYIMMGTAAFLVWRRGEGRQTALAAFGVQLALNALWSPAFFGLRSIAAGMVVIVPLLAAIAVTTVLFFRRSRLAGALMLPYLAWTAFATLLNLSLFIMNR